MTKLCVSRFAFVQLIFILTYAFQSILFRVAGVEDSHVTLLQYEFLAVYVWSLWSASKETGFFNLYVMFLLTSGVFLYSRIVLDAFGMFEWYWANKWTDFYFPADVRYKILSFLIWTLLFTHLGALLGKRYLVYRQIEFPHSPFLDKLSSGLFLAAVPGTLTKYLIQLKFIMSQGYLAVYDGSMSRLSYPVWTTGAISLMEAAYCLFLASRPSKKKFFIISSIFFALKIVDVMKGGRAKLFLPFIFVTWYYYSFLKEGRSISLIKAALFGLGGIFIAQVLVQVRVGNDFVMGNMGDLITLFFSQQGVSLLVLGYMVHYESLFVNHGAPYVLYPLVFWETFRGQSLDTVQHTVSLGHKLTYFLAPEAYLDGQGIGSSHIAEFWDLGWLGAVLMSFLLGYGIRYFEKAVRRSRTIMYLSFILVPAIVYMPRASFFPALMPILVALLFYWVIITWWNRRRRRATGDIAAEAENTLNR
ncbi:MAG: O-antigen polysaccharide polymerase Wzy family protein [Alistipes sp.]|nr:O-antigen polysaccharide polymerase Wzy family protein [Alistipes sp.]